MNSELVVEDIVKERSMKVGLHGAQLYHNKIFIVSNFHNIMTLDAL